MFLAPPILDPMKNYTAKEWVQCQMQMVSHHLNSADGELWVEHGGERLKIVKSHYFEMSCVSQAINCLQEELYWRQVCIMKKYC